MESVIAFPLIPKYVTLNNPEWLYYVKFCFRTTGALPIRGAGRLQKGQKHNSTSSGIEVDGRKGARKRKQNLQLFCRLSESTWHHKAKCDLDSTELVWNTGEVYTGASAAIWAMKAAVKMGKDIGEWFTQTLCGFRKQSRKNKYREWVWVSE